MFILNLIIRKEEIQLTNLSVIMLLRNTQKYPKNVQYSISSISNTKPALKQYLFKEGGFY